MPRNRDSQLIGALLEGRYQVTRWLADGGMGSVYQATDTRLGRDVAVKVLRHDLAESPGFVQRFTREAQLAAQLSHPNVVQVLDHGHDEDAVFLVMEYVPGRTLRQLINHHGALDPEFAIDITLQMVAGLAAAHRAGLIHRDIKPENVLITDEGIVKVVDFGLARTVASQTSHGGQGSVYGTVGYVAPEQIEPGHADARSDVFSAGLILFEMVTGQKAYTGDNAVNVAYARLKRPVPAPSGINPDVPTQLDTIVALATALDPDQRPPDAGVLWQVVSQEWSNATGVPGATSPIPGRMRAPAQHTQPIAQRTSGAPTEGAPLNSTTAIARNSHVGRRRLLIGLSLGALLAAALGWWFGAGPGATTQVPAVVGMAQAEAENNLSSANLTAQIKSMFSETAPKGQVISMDPNKGAEVRRGSTVVLTVSKGPERYEVPAMSSMNLNQAKEALGKLKLNVGSVKEGYSDSVKKGNIASSDPAAGTSVKPRSTVNLVVSRGPAPINVPDLTGQSLESATSTLENLDLKVKVAAGTIYSGTAKAGTVAKQSPTGTQIFPGDTITLTKSKGPEMVQVPRVIGKTESAARQALTAAGFKVRVERPLGQILGLVQSVSPSVGSSAKKGSTVTLTIV